LQKLLSVQDADITLINKNEYHYESTWLHETAAGSMNWEDGVYPIAKVLDNMKVRFVPAEVTKINRQAKRLQTTQVTFDFETLVVSLRFDSESFGIEGMDDYAQTIVNHQSAVRARETIEKNFITYKTP